MSSNTFISHGSTCIVPNVTLEKFRQKARKLKRESGISHTQALDQVAICNGFKHWHQVVESAKLTSVTENAFFNGLIIAMDVKDGLEFKDTKNRFVEDFQFCYLVEQKFFDLYANAEDEDGIKHNTYMSNEEMKQIVDEDMMNYIFFRFEGEVLPEDIPSVLKIVEECSYWPPMYFWFKGQFIDFFELPTEDFGDGISEIRF